MKNRALNRKILLAISIVFSLTSLAVSVNTMNVNFKEVLKNKTENKETPKIFNSESIKRNKAETDTDNKVRQISELLDTIDEAIKYIDKTLNEGSFNNVETLTNDCINAINSINKDLPSENRDSKFQESLCVLRSNFQDLDRFIKNKNLDKSKEVVENKILKDYSNILKYDKH